MTPPVGAKGNDKNTANSLPPASNVILTAGKDLKTKNLPGIPREINVGVTGFEPATPWSQTRCATNCATPRITVKLTLKWKSLYTQAPSPSKEVPYSAFVVGVTGFEPATPWSQTRCATNCATPRNYGFYKPQRAFLCQALPYR